MKTYYNEKGKLFTDVVSKVALTVIIQTPQQTIRGEIYLLPEDRLIDDLNQPLQFLAVTNAVVFSGTGKELYRTGFLTVNRSSITWISPEDEISQKPAYLAKE